jgi:peptide deformylase
MNIIRPPHHIMSQQVRSWKDIKDDAREMIALAAGTFKEGNYEHCFALSHSQVSDHPKTFFVVNLENEEMKKLFSSAVIVNPCIVDAKDEIKHKEACMSRPHRQPSWRLRWNKITVKYWIPKTVFGITFLWPQKETCEGLKAFLFQHEMEHFEGIY